MAYQISLNLFLIFILLLGKISSTSIKIKSKLGTKSNLASENTDEDNDNSQDKYSKCTILNFHP